MFSFPKKIAYLVLAVSLGAQAASDGFEPRDNSLKGAMLACQDLKNDDVILSFANYQGQTVWGNDRDLKTGLKCIGEDAENLLWAIARDMYAVGSNREPFLAE